MYPGMGSFRKAKWGRMAAIRRVTISRFRGFDSFEAVFREHVVLVGEPGSGRSDLIEAIARVLDPDTVRSRRGSELDFFDLDTSNDVRVELVVGDLAAPALAALTRNIDLWDRSDDVLIGSLPLGQVRDPSRHEIVIRFGYRLWVEDDDIHELIYWPKFADEATGIYPPVRQADRAQVPFLLQRGLGTRPLDLTPRGDFRSVVARQTTAAGFSAAVKTFLAAVEAGSAAFTSDPAVSAALEDVLREVRQARRLDEFKPATDLLAFLPDGGSEPGLLRTLAAAATLDGAPANLPTSRHGASMLASLRGGLLAAIASRTQGTVVVVDDFGGEVDPFLARHLVARLRSLSGQLIVSTRTAAVADAFAPSEVLRLHGCGSQRAASAGNTPRTKPQRLAARYWARYLLPALHASSVVIVEGHTDRLGFGALADRALHLRLLGSFDAAGIAIIEAGTNNQAPRLAEVAKELGLFSIVLLDNEAGQPLADDEIAQDAIKASDCLIRLPAGMSIEQALVDGVPDAELVRVFRELDTAVGGLTLRVGWDARTGGDLHRYLANLMHKRTGSIHEIYIDALDDAHLPKTALRALTEALRIGKARTATAPVEL
jgi:hypothetical protein